MEIAGCLQTAGYHPAAAVTVEDLQLSDQLRKHTVPSIPLM